jgi:hypothetical protein
MQYSRIRRGKKSTQNTEQKFSSSKLLQEGRKSGPTLPTPAGREFSEFKRIPAGREFSICSTHYNHMIEQQKF